MEQEDPTERGLTLTVLLPEGREKTVTVHGSKPVMDVLVILCARYRLNPSDHVIELFSTNHNKLNFKPSSLIGSLEAELVVLKPKRSDVRKTSNVPVATVRLMINYRKSHKAVVRVSPRVPLAELMPVVCEKCEMDPDTTVLLRDGQSEEPLDLTKTLNDYGIRDVYVKAVSSPPTAPATPTAEGTDCEKDKLVTQEKVLGEKENRGFLSLFRRSKKSADKTAPNSNTISAPNSLALKDPPVNNTATNSTSSTESSEMPKKRRAPQPPSMPGSQGVACEPNANQKAMLASSDNEKQGVPSRLSSTEASLKKNKRRAPPPPAISPSLPDSSDKEDDSNEDQSSDFNPTCSSVPSSPLMTEVLAEFNGRMKSMDHGDIWFDWSVTSSPPASNLPPLSAPQESDPVVPPGCELQRHGSQRDGLTTFTVVPRRRPQSFDTRQYEFLLTLETLETINGDTEGDLELDVLQSREVEKIEKVEQTTEEFEKVVGIADPFEKLNLNTDAEKEQSEDGDELEVHEQGDWIEEYRKRRRKFLMHDDGKEPNSLKLSTKVFDEETVVDAPPSIPTKLSVCWEEDDPEEQNLEEIESFVKEEIREDKVAKIFTVQPPNPSRSDPQHDPTFNPAYPQDPYWDVKLSSNISDSDTPFTSSENHSGLHNRQPFSDEPTSPQVSKSKPDPSFKHSSPSSVSRFALAVSQRVQRLGNGICPLIPSARRTTHQQSLGSRQTSSQKLYFQNLISEEAMSKKPCNEAPPISDDPPFVSMTPQARRQAWRSFSRTQLKNLEQK